MGFETRSFPTSLAATLAALPSMSLIPPAPFSEVRFRFVAQSRDYASPRRREGTEPARAGAERLDGKAARIAGTSGVTRVIK